MHDKTNSSKGHKDQRTKILIFLGQWASEMFAYQDFEEHQFLLGRLKQAYLESDWADDQEQRIEILQLFDQLEDLFKGLDRYKHEDFREIDKWILKLTA